MNVYASLVVHTRGVHLLRAGGNRRIARDDLCNRAAIGFNSQREWRDIKQQHVADAVFQNVGLCRRS